MSYGFLKFHKFKNYLEFKNFKWILKFKIIDGFIKSGTFILCKKIQIW